MLPAVLIAAAMLAQPPAPLAGPVVAKTPDPATLVQYDFNSRLRQPETSPEQAAVQLLKLSDAERARADEVFARRAALIDSFVARNLFLLQELDTAGKAGARLDQLALALRALAQLRPVLEPGPLRDQVAAVLPKPDAARFRTLVDQYWAAAVREGVRDARAAGRKEARWRIDLGLRFRQLAQEIARSFERQVASGTLYIDAFMAELNLSPEQARTINGLKLDMLQRTGLHPSEQDQKRLALGALAYLTEAQRTRVLKRLAGQ